MAFFKRELSPVERFESALKEKQAARQKLATGWVSPKRYLAKNAPPPNGWRWPVPPMPSLIGRDQHARRRGTRQDAARRIAELDEQIASTERALADAKAQRDRDLVADEIEAMAAAIEQAGRDLVPAPLRWWRLSPKARRRCRKRPGSRPAWMRSVARFSRLRLDLLGAAIRRVRTRAGNANITTGAAPEPEQPPPAEIERQLIYTLSPLRWREGSEVRRVPAFALVGLPKMLLPVALRHQHVDHLNARRVQTLIHVHGSTGVNSDPDHDDPQLVDLDALAKEETESAQADVA